MAAKRDVEALREFLANHSVAGYEVVVPILGNAKIERQISTGGGFIFYRVIADKPVPFGDFADAMRVSDKQMTLQEWKDKYIHQSTRSLPAMAVDLRDKLDAGETVSPRDVLFRELMDTGCLDIDQKVGCYTFDSRQVRVRALRKGMAVEVDDGSEAGWAGLVVGVDTSKKVVLLEQFAPVTFMRTPKTVVPDAIKPGFYSETVWTLGYGIVDAFELQSVEVPAGQWDDEHREYTLKEQMPFEKIRKFCDKHHPGERHCLYQAMALFIIPVDASKSTFSPLPEGREPEDYLVEYEE